MCKALPPSNFRKMEPLAVRHTSHGVVVHLSKSTKPTAAWALLKSFGVGHVPCSVWGVEVWFTLRDSIWVLERLLPQTEVRVLVKPENKHARFFPFPLFHEVAGRVVIRGELLSASRAQEWQSVWPVEGKR